MRAWLRTVFIVWDNVYGFDYSCIKDIALREPLVDTVELKSVVTDPYVIKVCCHQVIDDICLTSCRRSTSWRQQRRTWLSQHLLTSLLHAMTVSVIVLSIITAFMRATLDVHAFLAWFDIVFDCTHKKVKFSTGPHAQYTHWKYVCTQLSVVFFWHLFLLNRQTVFYTPSTITIKRGQKITGSISCAPNKRNNRDLDIGISYAVGDEEETTVEYKMCVILHSCRIPFLPQSDSWW
jgi:protein arginine N-methyltransferase 1